MDTLRKQGSCLSNRRDRRTSRKTNICAYAGPRSLLAFRQVGGYGNFAERDGRCQMQLTSALSRPVALQPNRRATVPSLVIEPNTTVLNTRAAILEGLGCSVWTACTSCDVFQLQLEDDPKIVVLSDALGDYHLRAVAEYARHRWPYAAIVVIGSVLPALEDQLYDESISARASPMEFVAVIERCTQIPKQL